MFQSETRAHHRAAREQAVVKRGGFAAAAARQFLVRITDQKTARVIFGGLDRAVFVRGEFAEARDVHRPDIHRRLALGHPFGDAQADAAGLAKAGHHADRGPVILHARHRPNHRIAVRPETEGPVHHVFDAGAPERGNARKRDFQPLADARQIRLEKFMPEIRRRAAEHPRRRFRLISAEQQALVFLAKIQIGFVINAAGQFAPGRLHFRNRLGDQVMMLHRLHRQIHPGKMPDLARPQPGRVDQHFRMQLATRRVHLPTSVSALRGCGHRRVAVPTRAERLRRFRVGVGNAGRIYVSVQRVVERAEIMLRLYQRMHARHFLQRNEFLVQPEVARLGALLLEIVQPRRRRREIKPAGLVVPDRLPGKFFQFRIQVDGVALQFGNVRVGTDGVNLPGRMPRRPGSQFGALQQHHILPAFFCKVKENAATDHAAADDDDAGVGGEGVGHGEFALNFFGRARRREL